MLRASGRYVDDARWRTRPFFATRRNRGEQPAKRGAFSQPSSEKPRARARDWPAWRRTPGNVTRPLPLPGIAKAARPHASVDADPCAVAGSLVEATRSICVPQDSRLRTYRQTRCATWDRQTDRREERRPCHLFRYTGLTRPGHPDPLRHALSRAGLRLSATGWTLGTSTSCGDALFDLPSRSCQKRLQAVSKTVGSYWIQDRASPQCRYECCARLNHDYRRLR